MAPALAAALRRVASDLRSGNGLEPLLAALGRVLPAFPGLEEVRLEPASGPMVFEGERLTLPLVGAAGPFGLMRFGPGMRDEFARDHLQFVSAVADVVSVLIDHALLARGQVASHELFGPALEQLPLGVLCFDASGAMSFANSAARHLLGGRMPVEWEGVWRDYAPAARRGTGLPFVRRDGARLVCFEPCRASANGPAALVLSDLAPRAAAFGETVAAETYRCLVERRPLVLGILAGPEGSPEPLRLLEGAGDVLPPGSRVGPVDADVAGVVVPDGSPVGVRNVLRSLATSAGAGGFSLGVEVLRPQGDTPQGLLARALAAVRPIGAAVRPEVLVCDPSPAVTETLAFVLRGDCSVTCANERGHSLELLKERSFDGIFLEIPAMRDVAFGEFVQSAVALQPAVRPFFVTELPRPWDLVEWGLPTGPVFRKPFSVQEIRAAIHSAFAPAAR